jgi:membrane fusion protein (multidrug efflux system)
MHDFRLLPALYVFVAAMALLAGCGKQSQQNNDGNSPVPVSTLTASKRTVPLLIESVGRAEGSRQIEIRARVSGILEKQTYSEGNMVKRGDVLFHIDPAPFEIALAHAKAALAQQEATAKQAQRDSVRLSALAAQNAVSRRQADDALSALDNANAGLLVARANVREAELNLSYTKVTAPIGGIAGRSIHSEGSLVTAGADSGLLTTVVQNDPLWVRFAMSESEYAALRDAGSSEDEPGSPAAHVPKDPGKALTVQLLRKDGKPFANPGRVNFSASEIDTQLGTIQLRAEFSNPGLDILPGEYVRVRLSIGAQSTIVVPQVAVQQSPKGAFVWIVNDKQQAEQRIVQTGAWVGSDWQVRTGLNEGDQVIVDNLLRVKVGSPLNVQPASQGSSSASEDPSRAERAKP